jgi:hypothetical protein
MDFPMMNELMESVLVSHFPPTHEVVLHSSRVEHEW